MRDLKPTGVIFEIDEHERHLILTLNVIDEIQEHYNMSLTDVCTLFKDELKRFAVVRYMLYVMLKEDAEIQNEFSENKIPVISEKSIGRVINLKTITTAIKKISEAIVAGSPEIPKQTTDNASENYIESTEGNTKN